MEPSISSISSSIPEIFCSVSCTLLVRLASVVLVWQTWVFPFQFYRSLGFFSNFIFCLFVLSNSILCLKLIFYWIVCAFMVFFKGSIHILFKILAILKSLSCASAELLFSEHIIIGLLVSEGDMLPWLFIFVSFGLWSRHLEFWCLNCFLV